MRVKKILFLIGLITLIVLIQACVSTTTSTNKYSTPTNRPEKTATSKPAKSEIETNPPQNTSTKSYFALGTVTANLCNLRQGPSTNYPIIGYSEKGTVHEIYGVNPEQTWLLLDKKQSIWIAVSLVSLDTNISFIPTINNLSSLADFTITEEPNQQMGVMTTQSFMEPEPTQFSGCPYGCTYHPPRCDIKGNISYTSGEKIYHVPGGEFYNETVISPDYGERWFCTESEALANGWRKSSQ